MKGVGEGRGIALAILWPVQPSQQPGESAEAAGFIILALTELRDRGAEETSIGLLETPADWC